jgi:hypothetical protein
MLQFRDFDCFVPLSFSTSGNPLIQEDSTKQIPFQHDFSFLEKEKSLKKDTAFESRFIQPLEEMLNNIVDETLLELSEKKDLSKTAPFLDFYKTRKCFEMEMEGGCPKGEDCIFYHNEEERRFEKCEKDEKCDGDCFFRFCCVDEFKEKYCNRIHSDESEWDYMKRTRTFPSPLDQQVKNIFFSATQKDASFLMDIAICKEYKDINIFVKDLGWNGKETKKINRRDARKTLSLLISNGKSNIRLLIVD